MTGIEGVASFLQELDGGRYQYLNNHVVVAVSCIMCWLCVMGLMLCRCSSYKAANASELYLKEHDHLLR